MCGIAGILHRDGEPVSPVLVRRMTDAIAHRGPDGEGCYTEGPLGLGHRRLAIIDLSPAGHQPMMTPGHHDGGRYVLTYNGEIYNFMALRAELAAQGVQFRSRSDAEVLLHAYAHWGAKVLDRLNGMFAFAIWDRERQELFLARDRYGIKPLYLTHTPEGRLLFGSEIKAILAHPAYRCDLNKQALLEYFTFQNFFTPQTLFKDIRILPAGHYLRVGLGTGTLPDPIPYWDFAFTEPEQPEDEQAYVEELDRLFCQAVNRQLVSDVDVGAYLSGGMDSGSITARAAMQLPFMKTLYRGV
jgi:asparagine synthase (glutamine-hydrolysing)